MTASILERTSITVTAADVRAAFRRGQALERARRAATGESLAGFAASQTPGDSSKKSVANSPLFIRHKP